MKRLTFAFAVAASASFFYAASTSASDGPETSSPKPPNVVLILADDVGYGDLSCYGAQSVQTPNIDRLAREGLRFTNARVASATCTPSRFALLTGRYPWRQKGTGILPGDAALIIPPGSETLPAIMKRAGYSTGIVGKWHLGLGNPKTPDRPQSDVDWNGEIGPGPLDVGFDYSFIFPATADRVPCVYIENRRVVNLDPNDPIRVDYQKKIGDEPTGRERPDLLKMKLNHGHDGTIVDGISRIGFMSGGKSALWRDETLAETFAGKACEFIERNQKTPFFLYFATSDVHVPRVANPKFAGKTTMGARGDVIVQLDWTVGQILETLDRLGIADNTIVLFSSDNGPVLQDGYEDGAEELVGDHKPGGPLRGGKYSAFEAGTRVPTILRWPAQVEPGVSDALWCLMDLPASAQALTGQPVSGADFWDSENMLDALLGRSPTGRKSLVLSGAAFSFVDDDWKIVLPSGGAAVAQFTHIETGSSPNPQVYRLSTDLGERDNRFEQEKERWEKMRAEYLKIRETPRKSDAN